MNFLLDDAFEGETIAQWYKTSGKADGKTFNNFSDWDQFVHSRFLSD